MEDRYARHHLLEGWDQRRLADAHVLVAGVGAVGNEVVKLLALMGVGHLLLIDFDTVEMSNLTRSVLFRATDIGVSKAQVAASRARELNPDVDVRWLQGHLEFDVGLGVYSAQDVVIGCLDSINARLGLNRACYKIGVPWINTGIESTVAEIALFQSDTGACFECAMSESMWERRNQRFSCGGLHSDLPENAVPTTATVASLTAALAVNEALLLLHGRKTLSELKEQSQENTLENNSEEKQLSEVPFFGLDFSQKLYITVAPYGMQTADLPLNPHCLAHDRWQPVTVLPQRASEITAAQLLRLAFDNAAQKMSGLTEPKIPAKDVTKITEIDTAEIEDIEEGIVEFGFDLLTFMRCLECGREEEILKPIEACSLALNHCSHCDMPSRQPETISWLGMHSALASRSLADLGIPEHQILAVKQGEERRYLQISGIYN